MVRLTTSTRQQTADGAQLALDIIAAYDIPPTANDPLFSFDLSQPVNNQTANIDGVEMAWQHFFGDSGFGFQANATFVNGDVGYNVRAASGQSSSSRCKDCRTPRTPC